ncbi:cation transporter, partial [Candidatus Saccharibacteria bacterium]|nr:cation transporter [Candidatus Saccharibacteria bacterium]
MIVKFALGLYVKKKGRDVKSDSLVASGTDAFNDAILSIAVLASAVIYMIFKIDFEAYVSVILSIFIIKSGIELIQESVNNVLGVRVESDLAKSIKREVMKEKGVQGAYDLVLNDYGPDKYLGSIHIEVPDTMSVADVDKISRSISRRVGEKFGVLLHTIGVYSINTTDPEVIAAKKQVEKIVFSHPEILQMHGFYLDEMRKTISFDIIIDFKAKDREGV